MPLSTDQLNMQGLAALASKQQGNLGLQNTGIQWGNYNQEVAKGLFAQALMQNQLQQIQMQGDNQLANTTLMGKNQLADTTLQGQNALDTGYQTGLFNYLDTKTNNEGAMDRTKLTNETDKQRNNLFGQQIQNQWDLGQGTQQIAQQTADQQGQYYKDQIEVQKAKQQMEIRKEWTNTNLRKRGVTAAALAESFKLGGTESLNKTIESFHNDGSIDDSTYTKLKKLPDDQKPFEIMKDLMYTHGGVVMKMGNSTGDSSGSSSVSSKNDSIGQAFGFNTGSNEYATKQSIDDAQEQVQYIPQMIKLLDKSMAILKDEPRIAKGSGKTAAWLKSADNIIPGTSELGAAIAAKGMQINNEGLGLGQLMTNAGTMNGQTNPNFIGFGKGSDQTMTEFPQKPVDINSTQLGRDIQDGDSIATKAAAFDAQRSVLKVLYSKVFSPRMMASNSEFFDKMLGDRTTYVSMPDGDKELLTKSQVSRNFLEDIYKVRQQLLKSGKVNSADIEQASFDQVAKKYQDKLNLMDQKQSITRKE